MTHGFQQCAVPGGKEWQQCDECVARAIEITSKRSPLAILTCGFAAVFRQQWGFLPEGVTDDE